MLRLLQIIFELWLDYLLCNASLAGSISVLFASVMSVDLSDVAHSRLIPSVPAGVV